MLNSVYVDELVRRALVEDIPYIDVTTDNLIEKTALGKAQIIAKDSGIICGLQFLMRTFELIGDFGENVKVKLVVQDGDKVHVGDVVAELEGAVCTLLKGERTALNFIGHLSGIATQTNAFVEKIKGTNAAISDTRKTLPCLRATQKYAVAIGGGKNHRFNLSDCVMLKDNHVDACGGIKQAVDKLRKKLGHTVKIEVEVRDFDELAAALDSGADIIMLDNMSLDDMEQAVSYADKRALLEASGNINIDTVADVAKTGVDIISVGALTHSVKNFDFSMKIC